MINAIRASLHPLRAMNRRVLVGGGGLMLLALGKAAMSLIAPFA